MVILLKTGVPEKGNHEYTKKDACCTDISNTFNFCIRSIICLYTDEYAPQTSINLWIKKPLKAWDDRI